PTANLSGSIRDQRREPAQSWIDAARIGLAEPRWEWEVHSQYVAERLPGTEPGLRAAIGNRLSGESATGSQYEARNSGKAFARSIADAARRLVSTSKRRDPGAALEGAVDWGAPRGVL